MRLSICIAVIGNVIFASGVFAGEAASETVSGAQVETAVPGIKVTLRQIIAEAEKNIRKADVEIERQARLARNEAREQEIMRYYRQGNELYRNGKMVEAKAAWKKALEISRDPEMRDYLKHALADGLPEQVVVPAAAETSGEKKSDAVSGKAIPGASEELGRQEEEIRRQTEELARREKEIDQRLQALDTGGSGGPGLQERMEHEIASLENPASGSSR